MHKKTHKEPSLFNQIKYLKTYLAPHKRVLIISFTLSALSTGLGMVQPYFAKILIDGVFLENQPQLLFPILGALIALLLVGFVIRVGNRYIYTKYSATILFTMREALFAHLQKIPLTYFSRNKIGDIYSRIASDMADIQALVTDIFPKYLFDALTFLITALILFWLNWQMAILSLLFLPVALWVVQKLKPKLFSLSEEMAKHNADIAHFLFEALSNTAIIRAFGAEKTEVEKLNEKQSGILTFLLKYQILGAISGSVPMGFSIFNTLVVYGFGGWQVLNGRLTIGTLVAFSVYQARVFAPLQGLLDGVLAVQKSKVALKRVREILDIPPGSDASGDRMLSDNEMAQDLIVDTITFSYDNAHTVQNSRNVLDSISFSIPQGKTTAIVGESGIGKTTLCHLLLRLYTPNAGGIQWAGIDIRDLDKTWFRNQVAVVSQETFLFHTSILENIRFFKPDADIETVKSAAKAAQLDGFIGSLPNGYDTVIGDRGTKLSGGQKQRLSIARAILIDPKILILDEATAFLDNKVEIEIKKTLEKWMTGKTIIQVSHRDSTIDQADKMIVLGREGVIYEGSVKAKERVSRKK